MLNAFSSLVKPDVMEHIKRGLKSENWPMCKINKLIKKIKIKIMFPPA